jgi:hypothetical protein
MQALHADREHPQGQRDPALDEEDIENWLKIFGSSQGE